MSELHIEVVKMPFEPIFTLEQIKRVQAGPLPDKSKDIKIKLLIQKVYEQGIHDAQVGENAYEIRT